MKPTYEEMLEGACKWVKKHKGVTYELSFHGYRPEGDSLGFYDEGHEGTWCYYLFVPEEMYPHRWDDFKTTYEGGVGREGPAWESVEFDSGITWASNERGWCRKTNTPKETAKVGCDYNHLWHRESGYPDTYFSVDLDAKRSVESLLEQHPDYYCHCPYTGVWGPKKYFYESVGGWLVHKTADIPEGWDTWKPKG